MNEVSGVPPQILRAMYLFILTLSVLPEGTATALPKLREDKAFP